jgi:hypothetical protein
MTWEENEKRDCREARFTHEGSKSCPTLGQHQSLSVSNIVPALKNAVQERRRFAIPRRVRGCLTSQPNTSARPNKLRRQRFNGPKKNSAAEHRKGDRGSGQSLREYPPPTHSRGYSATRDKPFKISNVNG